MKERVHEWDFLKGFLIIMIILGHVTASLGTFEKTGILNYFSSLTVSFIMPLFLIITGYFIYPQNEHIEWKYFFEKKALRMIIPALKWGFFGGVITGFILLVLGNPTIFDICKNFYWNIRYLWYLYATFFCALIVYLVEYICKNKSKSMTVIIYMIVTGLLLFIPSDIWNINFSFQFIMIGRILRKGEFTLNQLHLNKKICILISAIYFLTLILFPYKFSVYVAGTNLITNSSMLSQMFIVGFRFLVGLAGSITISFLLIEIYYCCKNLQSIDSLPRKLLRITEKIGENSLEMYCVQFILVERLFVLVVQLLDKYGITFTGNSYICYFLWRHLFGFLFVFITYKLIKWIKLRRIGTFLF